MGTVNNSLHLVEQRTRVRHAQEAFNRLGYELSDLSRDPENIPLLQLAERLSRELLGSVVEARNEQELKRSAEILAEFNQKTLFPAAAGACS